MEDDSKSAPYESSFARARSSMSLNLESVEEQVHTAGAYGILTNSLHERSKHVIFDDRARSPRHRRSPSPLSPVPLSPVNALYRTRSLSFLSRELSHPANNTTSTVNEDRFDEKVAALKDSVSDITSDICANTEKMTINEGDISANKVDINANKDAIAVHDTFITNNTNSICINRESIAANLESIANDDNRITANVDEIHTNHDEIAAFRGLMIESASAHKAYVTQTDGRLQMLEDGLFGVSPLSEEVPKSGVFGELRWFRKHRDECVVALFATNMVFCACLFVKCVAGSFGSEKK